MIYGYDSAYAPNVDALQDAANGGVKVWAGYFTGPNILNGWSKADFDRVKAAGFSTFAYCSGWSDPLAMRNQSNAWGIPICLDVEGGIRGDGSWVESWLAVSGAGLYGNGSVHYNSSGIRNASFHVFAGYYGYDPLTTWPGWLAKPSSPCGWQYQGSHTAFGVTVDSAWLDNAFIAAHGNPSGEIKSKFSGDTIVATPNNLHLFVRGALVPTGASYPDLWYKRWNGTAWENWHSLGGQLKSAWIKLAASKNRLDVFIQGGDDAIWHRASDDAGLTWTPWEGLGGNVSNGEVVVAGSWQSDPSSVVDLTPVMNALTQLETEVKAVNTVDLSSVLNAVAEVKGMAEAIKAKTDKDLA